MWADIILTRDDPLFNLFSEDNMNEERLYGVDYSDPERYADEISKFRAQFFGQLEKGALLRHFQSYINVTLRPLIVLYLTN